jgi:glycosyltransferase involved in cell wall biosynthesis
VIGISHAMLQRHGDVRGRRDTLVVHHPAEAVPGRPRPTPGAGLPLFGFLGQLAGNKGVHVLLEAAAAGGHRLLVAGRGPLEPMVRRAPNIDYVGWVSGEERERFFDRIDCLVVPSVWHEPAGLAVNEAYARGIPVIASAVGGLPEYVPDACRSLLATPGDAGSLAAAMTRFADAPAHYLPGRPDQRRGWVPHIEQILGAYTLAGAA